MSEQPESRKTYFIVFGILMLLLALTVAAAQIPNDLVNVVCAITIAVSKAVLILVFFMHLNHGSSFLRVLVAASFLWVGLLFLFTYGDYNTRHWSLTPEVHESDPKSDSKDNYNK